MSWTMSWIGGDAITPASPWITSSAHACQTRSVPIRNRTAQASDASIKSAWATWMSLRQSKLSARTPAYTENTRYGTQWLMTAKPASVGEWKDWKMTQ